MTLWDVLAATGRRWYVVAVGVALTLLALMAIRGQEPVYFSRAMIYLLAPASTVNPNILSTTSLDLVSTAGIVGKRVNGNTQLSKTASMSVTLVGRGILDGTSVRLPDNGGQWSANYDTQALEVQVAAPTPEEVRARQAELLARIEAELAALQDEANVPPASRITARVEPNPPPMEELSGERRRAQLASLILGGSLTLLGIGWIELRAARRQRTKESLAPSEHRA